MSLSLRTCPAEEIVKQAASYVTILSTFTSTAASYLRVVQLLRHSNDTHLLVQLHDNSGIAAYYAAQNCGCITSSTAGPHSPTNRGGRGQDGRDHVVHVNGLTSAKLAPKGFDIRRAEAEIDAPILLLL